ncbi:MAG: PilX N-terminal domain-containing pilus assembly protein [Pseudomonadota bacterium]
MRTPGSLNRPQRGIALAAALILLILVTIIGIAAIRGTTVQQRMTANFFDREVSFQNTEAGLAAGAAALNAGGAVVYNCVGSVQPCLANPFAPDPNLPASFIQTVATTTYEAGANAPGQPQYVIQLICSSCQDVDTSTGFNQSANAAQYGIQGVNSSGYNFYRVTARSCDPSSAACDDRSIVTLQATYRQ